MSVERPIFSNEASLRQELEEELSRLSDNPQAVLGELLQEFIQEQQENEDGNGISEATLAEVVASFEKGDYLSALLPLVTEIDSRPATRSPSRAITNTRRKLRAAFSQEGGVLTIGLPSSMFSLGRASHRVLEKLFLSPQFSFLNETQMELVEAESQVVEFVLKQNELPPRQLSFGREKISEDSNLALRVSLEEPLPVPIFGDSNIEWALEIFSTSFRIIKSAMGELPSKPYDVSEALRNRQSRKALMQMLETAHVIFGDQPGMSLIIKDPNTGRGEIKAEILDEFAVLNWLSVIRATLEVVGRERGVSSEAGLVTEMPTGTLKVRHTDEHGVSEFDIKSGVFDLGRFSWTKSSGQMDVYPQNRPSLSQVIRYAEGKYQSQIQRHHRVRAMEDGQKLIVRTKLGRTIRSLFTVLWSQYGRRLFTDLEIEINDFKFPGGDGGWWTVFNVENLPDKGHVQQMQEYLFLVVAQLCWVEKWSQGPGEDFALEVGEVIDFAQKYGILPRVKGQICYQLPGLEEEKEVAFVNGEEDLRSWGRRLVLDRHNSMLRHSTLGILRALERVAGHRIDGLEVTRQEPQKLPGCLKPFCLDVNHHFYLAIDDLRKQVSLEMSAERQVLEVEKAVFFEKEKIYVMWATQPTERTALRIAVDENGKFVISGLSEGLVSGDLLTKRTMRGVREVRAQVMVDFRSLIWEKLYEWAPVNQVEFAVGSDRVVNSDGSFQKPVNGKPLLCRMNVMTGSWHLDPQLIKEAVGSLVGKDEFGVDRLAELLNRKFTGSVQVFCPHPAHDNRNTEAATWYGGSHIFCHACQQSINVSTGKPRIERVPLAGGESVEDYRPVSKGRNKVFQTAHEVATIFARSDNDRAAWRYIAGRGLDPDHDLGLFGCISPEFSERLADLVSKDGFRKIIKESDGRDLRLDQVQALVSIKSIDGGEELVEATQRVVGLINQLPSYDRQSILKRLTLGMLREMKSRGVVGRSRMGWQRWGGRVLLPTYWFEKTRRGYRLAPANYIGRGIVVEGEPIYQGETHTKAYIRQSRKISGERRLRSTPTGVWFRDPEAFLLKARDIVFIFEGPISAASFGRIRPEFKDMCVTVLGTGFRQTIAFLRWLGVEGDRTEFGRGINVGIRRVCLANDFDKGGVMAYWRTRKHLEQVYPGIKIVNIHDFLPPEIREALPLYKLELFEEGGEWFEKKVDMNDIIQNPEFKKYAYNG